jgi:glutathione-specific gamma-glutamylcyclotransferase
MKDLGAGPDAGSDAGSDTGSIWVFGYGSLMWNPGFPFRCCFPGTLHGFHRSLCIYSHQYRGTPERPGLVFGLDRGGSCRGMVFEVDAAHWPETLAYLREREQLTNVYIEVFKRVRVEAFGGQVTALAFTVNRSHAQYAGQLPTEEILRLTQQGHGQFGTCTDYVRKTVEHLRELRIYDARLETLLALIGETSKIG